MTEQYYINLVKQYRPEMIAYASKILQDKDDAHDIVEEVFIKLWLKSSELEEIPEKVKWYLKSCVRNACFNYITRTRKKYENIVSLVKESTCLEVHHMQEQEDYRKRESLEIQFEKYTEMLAPSERNAFILYYYGGYKQTHIARFMNKSSQTIKNQVNGALTKIKKFIQEERENKIA